MVHAATAANQNSLLAPTMATGAMAAAPLKRGRKKIIKSTKKIAPILIAPAPIRTAENSVIQSVAERLGRHNATHRPVYIPIELAPPKCGNFEHSSPKRRFFRRYRESCGIILSAYLSLSLSLSLFRTHPCNLLTYLFQRLDPLLDTLIQWEIDPCHEAIIIPGHELATWSNQTVQQPFCWWEKIVETKICNFKKIR